MLKKKLSLVLSIVLLLSMLVFPVSADVVPYGSFVPVGELKIFAASDNGSSVPNVPGHAFLSFTNLLTVDVTLGSYTVAPGEEVTFGTFASIAAYNKHSGLWYNLEAYEYHENNMFKDSVCLYITIDYVMLEELNDLLAVNDGYSATTNNCVDFAVRIWNEIADDTLSGKLSESSISLPATLRDEIEERYGESYNAPLPNWTKVGYTYGGEFVTVFSQDN